MVPKCFIPDHKIFKRLKNTRYIRLDGGEDLPVCPNSYSATIRRLNHEVQMTFLSSPLAYVGFGLALLSIGLLQTHAGRSIGGYETHETHETHALRCCHKFPATR
jgi:hypothetical protein